MKFRVTIKQSSGSGRKSEYVTFSCLFPMGMVEDPAALVLIDSSGEQRPLQTRVLGFWPDGSVKWLQLVSRVECDTHSDTELIIQEGDRIAANIAMASEDSPDSFFINTGTARIWLSKTTFKPFQKVKVGGEGCVLVPDSRVTLQDTAGEKHSFVVSNFSIVEQGPLKTTVSIEGRSEQLAEVSLAAVYSFFGHSSAVKIDFSIHNGRAASHAGGLWDLGDPGSFNFEQLALVIDTHEADSTSLTMHSRSGVSDFSVPGKPLSVYQEASGGEFWSGPNHRNAAGVNPQQTNGYVISSGADIVGEGMRATPVLSSRGATGSLAVCQPLFWQNCPSALSATSNAVNIGLFPEQFPDSFELQGGEKKTQTVWIDFSGESNCLTEQLSPLLVEVDSEWLRSTQVIKDLPPENADLVDAFCHPEDFILKREAIDEYGWRHYGEVYADHEAVGTKQKEIFVSHYNNQYDLLAGFYRKYLATGNCNWKTLAQDLARHVVDIDIYHTDQDREEYNHGLFWHTDHYVPAGLATHRSYSREQSASYELSAGGGGPGSEHCYTGGLKLHYYLTGEERFKQVVLDLAGWELIALSGPRTVLAAIKRGIDLFKKSRSLTSKIVLLPRFPLTRGSGNAITACLDAFDLSNDRAWLDQAAEIITSSIHPADDITGRQLDNIEIAWSYTVFLAAMAKFLDVKVLLKELDRDFEQCRGALLVYTAWMAEHEYQYLAKPEKLEFPNETWAAQELRKAVVFYDAARYCHERERQRLFLEKANEFYNDACAELKRHPTSSLTRPVALILQNGWIGAALEEEKELALFEPPDVAISKKPMPVMSIKSILLYMLKDIVFSLQYTSLTKELRWLKSRV